jgi:RNA polymerase sigma-70 factor (ECF subfamily)
MSIGTTEDDVRADQDAIRRTLRGDVDAFAGLVNRYRQQVYACACGVLGNPHDAGDATQEAFLCLYRNLEQFDPERPLRPYLMTIAVNCARSLLRKQRHGRNAERDETAIAALPDHRPAAEQAHLRQERRQIVREALAELPAMLRETCVLFYLQGYSCREAAGILRTTEGAVKVALHRARERLLAGPLKEWLST